MLATLWIALIAVAIAAGSCSVDHRSDGFTTCDNQDDCPNNQVCTNNLCIAPGVGMDAGPIDASRPDALVCPSQCTSCNLQTMTCKVDCAVSAATCNTAITCPPGWKCDILCSTQNSCRSGIDCTEGESCNITCKGTGSCRNIVCGEGACKTECSGLQSCRNLSCGDSCACDVTCAQQADCEGVTCSEIQCETFNGCSSLLPTCNTCGG
ncbi:MAG: hypothetical protein ABI867_23360 [Kofleriaceae bacterium]